MLLELRFDHSALKSALQEEAKKRGYEENRFTYDEPRFTEVAYCQVPGYEEKNSYPVEPWAVPDLSWFVYCGESLTVELAIVEGYTLILYHDCKAYPKSPVKVPIKAMRSQEKILSLSGIKA